MFIPRANGDNCQSQLSCNPSNDADSTQQSSHTNDTGYHAHGPQRYIGVAMVAAGIVLALALWIWLGAWPKKALSMHCRERWRKPKRESNASVVIDLSASQPDLKKPKRVRIKEGEDILGAEQGEIQASSSLSESESGSEHVPNAKSEKSEKRRQDHEVRSRVRHEVQSLA